MSVSKLTNDGDWSFGQSLANYIQGSPEIAQNVITRIKSFKNDWFLDTDAEIDWFNLMGGRNTEESTKLQLTKAVLETDGVTVLNKLDFDIDRLNRKANIRITYTDIYGTENALETEV